MKAQYIATNVDRANELLKYGWKLSDHKLAVASGGVGGEGLSSYGIEYVANKVRVEARTFILELENAVKHNPYYGGRCSNSNCSSCLGTGWELDSTPPATEGREV